MRREDITIGQQVDYSPHLRQGGFGFRIISAEVLQIGRRVKIAFEDREAWVTPERLSLTRQDKWGDSIDNGSNGG